MTTHFPSPAEEELAGLLTLDQFLIPRREASFLVKVRGESLRQEGILPGDWIVVERGKRPKPGDLVVAEAQDRWSVLRFSAGAKITVQGVVVANVRKYR